MKIPRRLLQGASLISVNQLPKVVTPTPVDFKEIKVSFAPAARKLDPIMLKLKAFASNSPFTAYPVTASGDIISTTIQGGFKQLALYEIVDNQGTNNPSSKLIRTGGVESR
jgi:hypothetical protein